MLEKVEKTAKNLDEALKLAAEALGVSKEEVSYTVLREVGKGFMRLLVTPEIEISAWRTADAEKEAVASKKAEVKATKTENTEKKEKTKKLDREEKAPVKAKAVKREKVTREEKAEATETVKEVKVSPAREEDDSFVIPKSAVDDAKFFVSGVLSKIGLTFELNVKLDKNIINIDVSGDKMGLLIGKRGDTIDAVQTLTGLYVNRNKNMPYIKVNIDTENYRKKREETLVRLAHGLERSVLRDKKSITLEPMTSNERRIIHSALQNNPKIKTYSIGEEPNRRMVVALNKTGSDSEE